MFPVAQRAIKIVLENEAALLEPLGYDIRGKPKLLDPCTIDASIDTNFLQHFERHCGQVHKPDRTGDPGNFVSCYGAKCGTYFADSITLAIAEIVGEHARIAGRHEDQ